jgi:hypothetical protein
MTTRSVSVSGTKTDMIRLLSQADALVETGGVDGRIPEVRTAAGQLAGAYYLGDWPLFRSRLAEFEALVRRRAAERAS